jgi:hypothetical protein
MTTIVTDKPKEYTPFLTESIDNLGKEDIKGLAVSAICKDGNVFTGYWHLNLQDKAIIHTNIQYDCIDELIYANRGKYQEPMNDDESEDN